MCPLEQSPLFCKRYLAGVEPRACPTVGGRPVRMAWRSGASSPTPAAPRLCRPHWSRSPTPAPPPHTHVCPAAQAAARSLAPAPRKAHIPSLLPGGVPSLSPPDAPWGWPYALSTASAPRFPAKDRLCLQGLGGQDPHPPQPGCASVTARTPLGRGDEGTPSPGPVQGLRRPSSQRSPAPAPWDPPEDPEALLGSVLPKVEPLELGGVKS